MRLIAAAAHASAIIAFTARELLRIWSVSELPLLTWKFFEFSKTSRAAFARGLIYLQIPNDLAASISDHCSPITDH